MVKKKRAPSDLIIRSDPAGAMENTVPQNRAAKSRANAGKSKARQQKQAKLQ
jgi:hypothetical protein